MFSQIFFSNFQETEHSYIFLYFRKDMFRIVLYSEHCEASIMERFATIATWCTFKLRLKK